MRLAHSHPAATRQGRADQLKRDRTASQALRSAFPSVERLRIAFKFEGPIANTPASHLHVLYPPARAFFGYPCPYSDCDGHFDLGNAVKAALADEGNVSKGMLECDGSRARDHASKQPCQLQLSYEVAATVREKP